MVGHGQGRTPPRLGDGRFRIIDTLGDGGTATVYLCWDEREHQWCALKAIQRKFIDDEDMKRRFDQEADTLSMFSHPNIPKLIFHDSSARPPFMVMELARNGSAMDWVRTNGPMPPTMAADVLFQVCQALDKAHNAGIVHRDVKPHNFLLDENGVCKLTDFGIARWTDTTSLTATGSQIGTFSFMAPEQRSDTKSVDERADVYSLGASLFTMLTGRTSAELFVAEDDDNLLADVAPPFREVILRATRYRANDRYASAIAFRNELMAALARLPSTDTDFPPLVHRREALPALPPDVLPAGTVFPELDEFVAPPSAEEPPAEVSVTGVTKPDRTDVMAAIGYRMPERPNARQPRRELAPEYIVSEEGAYYTLARDEITQNIAQQVREEVAEAMRQAEDSEEGAGPLGIGYAATAILGLALAVFAAISFIAVTGGVLVSYHHQNTQQAASGLLEALAVEGNVIIEVAVNQGPLESAYHDYADAKGKERIRAAVRFVDLLESAVDGQTLPPEARTKVNRLRAARDGYHESAAAWENAAVSFPGNVAVRSKMVSAP